MKVSLVTLGCAKNEVDSEMLLGFLQKIGFKLPEINEEYINFFLKTFC